MARSGYSVENSANTRASWIFPPIPGRRGWSHPEASGRARNALTTSAFDARDIAVASMTGPTQCGANESNASSCIGEGTIFLFNLAGEPLRSTGRLARLAASRVSSGEASCSMHVRCSGSVRSSGVAGRYSPTARSKAANSSADQWGHALATSRSVVVVVPRVAPSRSLRESARRKAKACEAKRAGDSENNVGHQPLRRNRFECADPTGPGEPCIGISLGETFGGGTKGFQQCRFGMAHRTFLLEAENRVHAERIVHMLPTGFACGAQCKEILLEPWPEHLKEQCRSSRRQSRKALPNPAMCRPTPFRGRRGSFFMCHATSSSRLRNSGLGRPVRLTVSALAAWRSRTSRARNYLERCVGLVDSHERDDMIHEMRGDLGPLDYGASGREGVL